MASKKQEGQEFETPAVEPLEMGGVNFPFVKLQTGEPTVFAFLQKSSIETYWLDPNIRPTPGKAPEKCADAKLAKDRSYRRHDIWLVYVQGGIDFRDESFIVGQLDVKGRLFGSLKKAKVQKGELVAVTKHGDGIGTEYAIERAPWTRTDAMLYAEALVSVAHVTPAPAQSEMDEEVPF